MCNGEGRGMLTEPFEHYCFIVETATELIRRVCLLRPRLYCKCLRTRKYTAKPSQRQDSSARGGKFYLVEFAASLGFDAKYGALKIELLNRGKTKSKSKAWLWGAN